MEPAPSHLVRSHRPDEFRPNYYDSVGQTPDQMYYSRSDQRSYYLNRQNHYQVPPTQVPNPDTTPILPNHFSNQLTPIPFRDNQPFSPFVGYQNEPQALGLGLQPMHRLPQNQHSEFNHHQQQQHSDFNNHQHHGSLHPNLTLNTGGHLPSNVDLQPYSPFPMFESPLVGFPSEQSTPARFGSMFPSPWQDNEGFDSGTGVDETSCQWEGCQEVFLGMDELIRHVVDNHIGSGRSMYECRWHGCKRDTRPFPKRHKMLNHFRTHTGEKPYLCRYPSCKKAFSRPDSLATHIKTHSDIRPFACVIPNCGRAYYHSRSLRKHLLAHAAKPSPYVDLINQALEATKPKTKETPRSM